jgi:uncharacterized membrane protein
VENKKKNIFFRIVCILGIIFCIISLLTPWSSSAFTFGIFKENYSSPLYIDFFTDQSIRDPSFSNPALFFSIIMIIILFFTIFALLLGIICITKIEKEVSITYFLISYLFIANIILYVTAVSFWPSNVSYVGSSYNYGFITAIIALIIYLLLFIFKSIFHKKAKPIQKTKKQKTMNFKKNSRNDRKK